MRRASFPALGLGALLFQLSAAGGWAAQKVAVVLEQGSGSQQPVLDALRLAAADKLELTVTRLDRARLADPIQKGRFLAGLQNNDLVIPLGDGPTRLLLDEMEGTPIYFVGAGILGGKELKSQDVAGILSYNVGQVLDLGKALWPGVLGLIYTPGYEGVAGWIQAGAKARGIDMRPVRVTTASGLSPALRSLADQVQAVWVLGDPLLSRGAGFQFIAELSLSRKLPVIATGSWEVEHGALIGMRPDPESLAAVAGPLLREIIELGLKFPKDRIRQGPAKGGFLVSGPLAERWGLKLPPGISWKALR